ncbi:MAG TPA: hypothetical protein VNO69_05785 [Methyloceanibacter sp.]|nr:hypothetical protein [Methyloceanibacter sp.]
MSASVQRFSRLSCFSASATSVAAVELQNLRTHVTSLSKLAIKAIRSKSTDKLVVAPFLGRSLLECVFAALLIRIDKFRGAAVSRFAAHQNYDPNLPQKHSMSWQGDVVPRERPEPDIWAPTVKPDAVSRALFSDYCIDIFWASATVEMLDYIQDNGLLVDVTPFSSHAPHALFARYKGQAMQLYSLFSKGLHGDYLMMRVSPFDALTADEALRQTLDILVQMSLISHFVADSIDCLPRAQAIAAYESAKELSDV